MKTYLVDPTTMGVFQFQKKTILVLGEVHGLKNCPMDRKDTRFLHWKDFIPWYHQCIGTDRVLDIFSESFYSVPKHMGVWNTLRRLHYNYSTRDYGLGHLRKTLDRCTPKYDLPLLTNFQCPDNIRVHLCDTRFFYAFNSRSPKQCSLCLFQRLCQLSSHMLEEEPPYASYKLWEISQFIQEFLTDHTSPLYYENLHPQLMGALKIQKQLDHIPSPPVRRVLQEWGGSLRAKKLRQFRKGFEKFQKTYQDQLRPLPGGFFPVEPPCARAFQEALGNPLLDVLSYYMDMYLMARVFRVFADGTTPEHCIVYVGAYHADLCYKLMNKLRARAILRPRCERMRKSREKKV